MEHTMIAVDVAKSVFEVAVSRHPGQVAERHRLSRDAFLRFFAERRPATVLMEACGSAHHWGRQIESLGHHLLFLPPHQTRPYVLGNKTDRNDAKGLLEAQRNEQIHPVPVKSLDQQALSALHRLRSAWLAARTARINTVRGLLREFSPSATFTKWPCGRSPDTRCWAVGLRPRWASYTRSSRAAWSTVMISTDSP